jgi:hypothetical protein
MFDALTSPSLATSPHKGIGARIVRGLGRVGAALHGVVAGRLRRRPSDPDSPIAPDADGSTAAMPARAPRQPRRTPIGVPDRHHDLAFTAAAFPDLTPAAREFFNTPVEDCDPAMLGLVLEQLAGAIAGMMTPQDGMQDARDVFLALNSRLGALTGGMQGTPPETVPDAPATLATLATLADPAAPGDPATLANSAAPGDPATLANPATPADRAATNPQAASPDLAGSAPACGSAAPTPDDGAGSQCEATPATAGSDQPAAPPGAQPPSDLSLIDIGTNTTPAPHGSRVGPRQTRRRSCRGGRRFAAGRFATRRCAARRSAFPQRSIPFHRRNIVGCPLRLLCYAACAGPPRWRARQTRRALSRDMHGAAAWRSRNT